MNELMIRLIKDGKIVGWEHKELIDGLVRTQYSSSKEDGIHFWVESPISQYDSFDMGIKVGDNEWWFDNDKIKMKGHSEPGVLIYEVDNMRWCIKCSIEGHKWKYTTLKFMSLYYVNFKRIGSIYEEKSDAK